MPKPLTLSEKSLEQHVRALESSIQSTLDARVGLDIQGWGVSSSVRAFLAGQDCERVSRVRGPDSFVVPLLYLGKELWAWLGLQEEWESTKRGKSHQFEFRSIGLTVHFGYRNENTKPQIFRAEWSGWSKWIDSNYGFQAGDVGHPHWQYDALESLSAAYESTRVEEDLARLEKDDDTVEIQEFEEGRISAANVEDEVKSRKLSRIHFPSAAAWWTKAPNNLHTHAPASRTEIEKWASETLTYTVKELARV